MRNIALFLTYVGTAYHGWQVQKRDVTIGQTMEEAAAAPTPASTPGAMWPTSTPPPPFPPTACPTP